MISVIIPVRNGVQTLEKCLRSIREQTVSDIEIIILDSMSVDGSREIAFRYGASIIDIPEGTFDHGLTRNIGAEHAAGNYLFYTVQDAWLSENTALETMQKHFDDICVMGVVGHQAVPHEKDKNPLYWYKRYSIPKAVTRNLKEPATYNTLSPQQQRSLIAWDDVAAMYRKVALLELPFVATEFAEDWIWSRDALLKGWSLVYDPSIIVYHYHHYTYTYAYKVSYSVNFHLYKYFGFKPAMPGWFLETLRTIYHLGKNNELTPNEKIYWIKHNLTRIAGMWFSHADFLLRDFVGGLRLVEKRYSRVCNTIPQGLQNKVQ